VIGAGYTGRCVIKLLTALNAEVWVYDPYLTPADADALGVRKVTLDELLANAAVVTMQAPPTDETYHMIGARELRLLQDGAIFINTARSHLVDETALLAELQSGRIQAALDVFDQEPLPPDHPLRQLENVILTPHIAGASQQARLRQGQIIVDEIARFVAGEPLQYGVTEAMLATMA
jgi:phosphoglycerate dehydrogenase-like enzyme